MFEAYLTPEQRLTMLANWLKGEHREDLELFDADLFKGYYPNIYKAAKAGEQTFLQLMAKGQNDGVQISDFEIAFDDGGRGFSDLNYQDARAEAIKMQRDMIADKLKNGGEDFPELMERMHKLQAIIEKREAKPAASDLAAKFMEALDKEAKQETLKYGAGFEDLDRRAGSIRRGQLIVLAARPATGKSAAALQIASNISRQGAKVLFFPLEMTTNETLERLILQRQKIDSQAALKALRPDERERIRAFLDDLEKQGNFLIYEGVNNLETIQQIIKEQRPDFVVLDQLTQIQTAKKTKDIRERYVTITADLKHAAMEYETAILLLTQLNRDADNRERPTLANLHESDATGQNADVVLLMAKADDEQSNYNALDDIAIWIEKNRQGKSGTKVNLVFNGDRYTFSGTEYREY